MAEKKTTGGATEASQPTQPASQENPVSGNEPEQQKQTEKKTETPKLKTIKADVTVSRGNIERAVANGTSSQSVKLIQDALTVNGLYEAKVDGVAGPKTKAAMKNLAETHGVDNPTDAVVLLGFHLI